jgi:hypothetical protein
MNVMSNTMHHHMFTKVITAISAHRSHRKRQPMLMLNRVKANFPTNIPMVALRLNSIFSGNMQPW